jgi:exosortase/archaeosortase family protein
MGKIQKKKSKNQPSDPRPSFLDRMRTRWGQKWPVIVFVLGFAVLMALFYIFKFSDFYEEVIHPFIVSGNAVISSFILNIFGMKTVAIAENINSAKFSVCIASGCDAVEAMALFGTALLAFPAKWKFKLIGFFAGVAILFILNIIRIVTLFLTGIYFPKAFELMHVEVWQAVFILIAVGLWIFWIKWTRKGVPDVKN